MLRLVSKALFQKSVWFLLIFINNIIIWKGITHKDKHPEKKQNFGCKRNESQAESLGKYS